ncbi:hypothetical protein CKO31_10735 [Thiohalocapsa halophila]|uniref:Uncharacterized protein n=1 Tax=Thiohalocapsa halophila TaxID=69359 RepID=A0ABS1CH06_9GAMM|nr:hypothetical protein [Thiohalocapsa halophila]MBK1631205.1 hypothetical protein [Thiohalocapsa halophila]
MADAPARPEYVPAPVWQCWLELRARPHFDSPAMTAAAPRLLGIAPDSPCDPAGPPEIARTWWRLAKVRRSDTDWRLIFDAFWTLPESTDPEARAALHACRTLAPEIADLADALADRLATYCETAERHRITAPDAALLPEALLSAAAMRTPRPDRFAEHCAPWLTTGNAPGVNVEHLPDPLALVRTLADAFAEHEPACNAPGGEHASDRETARVAHWVRHLDRRLARLQYSLHAPLHIGDADAARLLSAAVGGPFTRKAVAEARARQNRNN